MGRCSSFNQKKWKVLGDYLGHSVKTQKDHDRNKAELTYGFPTLAPEKLDHKTGLNKFKGI